MATQKQELARLQAEVAALRAAATSSRVPSLTMCRAIVKSGAALQRREYILRFPDRKYATSIEVARWVDECLVALGLA